MSFVSIDSNSKVSLNKEFKEELPPRRAIDAQEAVNLVNRLYADIAGNKGELAAPGSAPSKGPTQNAQKLVKQGIEALTRQTSNAPEAITLFTKALETVLSRSYFESMELTMGEVCQCLGPRCDAYMASKNWPKAYADASMLLLLNPKDAQAYFRKGVCLFEADKIDEAAIMLEYAAVLAPQNPMVAGFLAKINDQKKRRI